MSEGCLFAVSILLLLWLLTGGALVHCWKKMRDLIHRSPTAQDMLLGLATEKIREAQDASVRLQEVADALGIGLVELGPGGTCNHRAEKWLEKICGDGSTMDLNSLIGEKDTVTAEVDGRVLLLHKKTLGPESRDLVVIQDITDSFRAAQRLKAQEKLAILGKMSAQAAHQLKTPLAVLAGKAQMLARRLYDAPELKIQADDIYQEARDMAERVNQLVEFYRERPSTTSRVELGGILASVANRLKAEAPQGKVLVSGGPCSVTTDPWVLESVIFLVAQNSLKPSVGASEVRMEALCAGERVEVHVRDDGKGIAPAALETIFEPFATREKDGLGLGLFLARDLCERIGAELKALPSAVGAHFVIELTAG